MVLMWEGKNCVEFFSFCFSFLSKQAGGGTASRAGSVERQQQPLRVLFTCVRDGSDNFEEGRLFFIVFLLSLGLSQVGYTPLLWLFVLVGRGSGCDDNKEEILDRWSLSNFRRNLGNIILIS